jgi:hypothetical protein
MQAVEGGRGWIPMWSVTIATWCSVRATSSMVPECGVEFRPRGLVQAIACSHPRIVRLPTS